jgi:hypothetical protein
MKDFKNTMKLMENVRNTMNVVRKNALEYIKETLKNLDENEIIFDYEEYEVPYINYDGGNHPEYDAYPFAPVVRIYLKNDIVYADLDEFDTEYDVDARCCYPEDVYEIAEKVYEKMNEGEE